MNLIIVGLNHKSSPVEIREKLSFPAATIGAAVSPPCRGGAGLDSMVGGEPQILGQVKDSYGYAVEHDTAGVIINKLYHKAFQVAKRIRTVSQIGETAVYISSCAV